LPLLLRRFLFNFFFFWYIYFVFVPCISLFSPDDLTCNTVLFVSVYNHVFIVIIRYTCHHP
uniref:Uncharacterized protein n=1 Tax=Leptobrachium leishanense TaxID=445787 RepID=A0A8C5ME08_9ANUR